MTKKSCIRRLIRKGSCVFLALSFLLFPTQVMAASTPELSYADGVVTVSFPDGAQGSVQLRIYSEAGTIYSSPEKPIDGDSAAFGLPLRSIPLGEYKLAASHSDGEETSEKTMTITLGNPGEVVFTPSQSYAYSTGALLSTGQTPGFCRAVMTPYATVYTSASMTGKQAELKRMDLVNVLSCNDVIAKVQYTIQSGNGYITKVDGKNALYHPVDDKTGVGYMYMSAFRSPDKTAEDMQREAVELAYTRLGMRGVYSQSRRYIGYYLDCAALCSWCWYMVSNDAINTDFGSWTSCTGIWNWANGITDRNVIVWDAEPDPEATSAWISDYREANAHGEEEPCDCELLFVRSNGDVYTENEVVVYKKTFTYDLFEKMEPGDIILFNYTRNVTEQAHDNRVSLKFNEIGDAGVQLGGYDHAAIYVGMSNGNARYIECSTPSEVASKNTHITTVSATSGKVADICAVIRPTGGQAF